MTLPFAPAQPGVADPSLDTCGCCQGEAPRPLIHNRPGLSALVYRIGTHPTFLRSILARLPSVRVDGARRPLAPLTTRAPDDGAIALLDAWATVADVLTFYQERIANEGFLRTATERRSVLELARAIGYELNPGVAASTYLAFTVEAAKGAPGRATIAVGVKVQSVPGQDERPQVFETVEQIEARAEWNVLTPRLTEPQGFREGLTRVLLAGVNTGLQLGDAILVVDDVPRQDPASPLWDFRVVRAVTIYPEQRYTLVEWDDGLSSTWATGETVTNPRVFALRQRAALFGYNAPDWRTVPVPVKAVYKTDVTNPEDTPSYDTAAWGVDWPSNVFRITPPSASPPTPPAVDLDAVYPRIQVGDWAVLVAPDRKALYRVTDVTTASRTDYTLTAKTTRLELDTGEDLAQFGLRETVVFCQSEELSLAEQPIVALVHGTQIELAQRVLGLEQGRTILVAGKRRRVRITQDAREDLALTSDDDPTETLPLSPGDVLTILDPPTPAPPAPSEEREWHLLSRDGFRGTATMTDQEILEEAAGEADEQLVEAAELASVRERGERTVLDVADPLRNSYDRATVKIWGNVARATHGETVREVLGGGDGSRSNQRFTLKRPFVTHVPAPTPTGGQGTLGIRVNGVLWNEVRSLYGLDATSQRYVARIDNDARTTVVFGDGERGARLPAGLENVVATYRTGLGPDGEVRADALTLLQTRPFGVREVTNPLSATGAAAPEVLDDARANAPLTVLTLDRIVSLQDFEDFARAFAGIGKAQAVTLWRGEHRIVFITVAAASGKPVDPDSDLYDDLVDAIDRFRDPAALVEVGSYTLRTFSLDARVLIDPRYLADDVLPRVRSALTAGFGFARRTFGQPATAADALSVMQAVPGVLAIDLDRLEPDARADQRAVGPAPSATPVQLEATAPTEPPDWAQVATLTGTRDSVPPTQVLVARPARLTAAGIQPAELLLINPFGITLTPVTT